MRISGGRRVDPWSSKGLGHLGQIWGCTGLFHGNSYVIPETDADDPGGLTSAAQQESTDRQTHLWGYFDIALDPETMEAAAGRSH